MTAAAVLAAALADGLSLTPADDGTLAVRGPAEARARHLQALREHKADLLALLTDPRRLWHITEPDGTRWTSSFTPPQTWAEVLSRYASGTVAAPVAADHGPPRHRGGMGMSWRTVMGLPHDPLTQNSQNTQNPREWGNSAYCADIAYGPQGVMPPPEHGPQDAVTGEPMSPQDRATVEAAMDALGEDDPQTRREVLDRCATDPEALAFWTARAPDPRQALYRRWLEGITEPRALLTLDPTQTREAVSAGVVSRELARDNVLVLVKVPGGEAGPGAVGLLSVPREKWAGFSPTAALEAMARGDH